LHGSGEQRGVGSSVALGTEARPLAPMWRAMVARAALVRDRQRMGELLRRTGELLWHASKRRRVELWRCTGDGARSDGAGSCERRAVRWLGARARGAWRGTTVTDPAIRANDGRSEL